MFIRTQMQIQMVHVKKDNGTFSLIFCAQNVLSFQNLICFMHQPFISSSELAYLTLYFSVKPCSPFVFFFLNVTMYLKYANTVLSNSFSFPIFSQNCASMVLL